MVTRRDYTAEAVEAAKSVLIELTHLLGEYRDSIDGQPRPRPLHGSDYYETPLGRFYHTGGKGRFISLSSGGDQASVKGGKAPVPPDGPPR